MEDNFSSRTAMMLGKEGYRRLTSARVAVFGIGGVGGYAVEALARAGVGAIDLIDSDKVSESNLNRQIIATKKTLGQYKTEAARDRILSINPDCKVLCHSVFFSEESSSQFDFGEYDYVIDAIDSVKQKIELIRRATEAGVKIISAMGAGNKLDPTRFRVADISKTSVCPLAKAVRLGLRKIGINHLKVVYSDEPPFRSLTEGDEVTFDKDISEEQKKYAQRRSPGSISFVPSVMGLILGGEVIRDIAGL